VRAKKAFVCRGDGENRGRKGLVNEGGNGLNRRLRSQARFHKWCARGQNEGISSTK